MSQKIVIFLLGIVFISSNFAIAQSDAGCITSDCHADKIGKDFVHGPVGAGICSVCHVPVDGKDHEFNFFSEKAELCFACHEGKRDMLLEDFIHNPVMTGDCIGCHDPHQSDHRYTLKGVAAELCFQCHDKAKFEANFVHGPIAGGNCNVCHNPHASAVENQLTRPIEQLCITCHDEKSDVMSKRHKHPPAAESCLNCHQPHASNEKMMLNSAVPGLCSECHNSMPEPTYPHPPVAKGDCSSCHDAHGSEHPLLFTKASQDLCLSCHETQAIELAEKEFKHGPINEGDCNACHSPHGSENFRILKKYFPKEFYIPYNTENYAMCFECHNQNIALDAETKTLTDFRDGKRNLHYLHVNKEKGRSCRSCHSEHAANQNKHIRNSVPYGSMNWELPVEFTKFEDGGKCVVGCHSPKEYHR